VGLPPPHPGPSVAPSLKLGKENDRSQKPREHKRLLRSLCTGLSFAYRTQKLILANWVTRMELSPHLMNQSTSAWTTLGTVTLQGDVLRCPEFSGSWRERTF
jgi:hypothetical protein